MAKDLKRVFIWPPPERRLGLSIHIPASLISIEHGIVKRTMVLGLVARAAAIFRVRRIRVYRDPGSGAWELDFVKKILRYIASPPYLRKRLFKIDRDLRAVGLLPPLAIASHPTEEDLMKEHIRPALVLRAGKRSICLEAGLSGVTCIDTSDTFRLNKGDLVYVVVTPGRGASRLATPEEVGSIYWGYFVETYNSLRESIEASNEDLYIVSTKEGAHGGRDLFTRIRDARRGISVIFGSPDKDPDEIAEEEGWDIDRLTHYKLNSAPLQGVRSIRTYEALYITLAILNSALFVIEDSL